MGSTPYDNSTVSRNISSSPNAKYHNTYTTTPYSASPSSMSRNRDYTDMEYHATSSKVAKPTFAIKSGPTRSFMGWAFIKTGKLSRYTRRFVILRSCSLIICTTDNPRSATLTVPILNASMISTGTRYECLFKAGSHRIWIQWSSETELRVCKAAFEFANRRVEDFYKLVNHRQLGKGRASEVIFAFDTMTGDHAAVKVMNKDKARSTDREFAEKEVIMRMTIQHPCIVQTLDIFESSYDLFVVMELMGGGALDRRMMKQNSPLLESEARIIMRRLFAALSHLHSRNIAHRNVKPQNIFLDYSDELHWPETAKLSDFSLACFLDDPDSSRQIVGTPEYLAPEASLMTRTADGEREVVFGTEVDMWAAGVTLYNMLSMELPFEGEYPPEVFKKARSGKLGFSKRFRHVSSSARSLIRALLNVDRRKRPTSSTVLLHPWFEDDIVVRRAREMALVRRSTRSDGVARFRAAALSVLAMNRIISRTPGLQLRPVRIEKRFEFNISGIDIEPIREMSLPDAEVSGKRPGKRTSGTVMSRVSTGSTVRSSVGDPAPGPFHSRGSAPRMQRSDAQSDYFGRPRRTDSFGNGSVIGVHRLMSDTAGLFASEEKGNWRWRRRGKREEQ